MYNRQQIVSALHKIFGTPLSEFEGLNKHELNAYLVNHFSLRQRYYLTKYIKESQ